MLKDGEDELEDLDPPGEDEAITVGFYHFKEDGQTASSDVKLATR